MAIPSRYHSEVLDVVTVAHGTYPDSRNLALAHAELLAECGNKTHALEACESFLSCFGVEEELLQTALKLCEPAGLYDRLAGGGQQSISLCMIVKDEESCLARCLASVKPVVHEMIVIDTGSTDRTVAIATIFGARVVSFPWNGSFADARNYGIERAKGAWILVLDADEVLAMQDHAAIAEAVRSAVKEIKAFSVLTRNYTTMINAQGWTANDGSYPAEERADGWQPSRKVRLFPNNCQFSFRGEVHEMVEASLREAAVPIETASFVIHHYGELEQDPVSRLDKKQRYLDAGMQKLADNPDDLAAVCELAVQAGELGRFDDGIELWDRVLVKHPDYVEALFNKGYCLMGLQRYSEALSVASRTLGLAPNHKEAAFNYGTCELYVGDPQRGLNTIEPIAARHPEYPLLQALVAAIACVCGNRAEASKRAEQLRDKGYAIDAYFRERAAVLRQLGRDELAALLSNTGST